MRRTAVLDAWAGQGIVLNAVAPGIVATDVVMRTWQQDEPLGPIMIETVSAPIGQVA